MPKYTKEKREEHKEIIRTLIVKNPALTIYEAQRQLLNDAEKLKLDKDYIHKIMKEIQSERTPAQINRTEKVFFDFQNESMVAKKFLWDIVDNNKETSFLRMSALKEIRNWSTNMIDRVINANLPEKTALIQQNYQTNFIGSSKIDELSPDEIEAKTIETIERLERGLARTKSIKVSLNNNSPESNEAIEKIENGLAKIKAARALRGKGSESPEIEGKNPFLSTTN